MAKTVYSIKTLDGNPVRAEEAWKDSDGGLLNKKVTTDTDQTIDGVKTFSTYAKIDEIDNTSGNALVRHKATEGKNVFGGVNHDAVIMGKSDRPYYSKDGADFDGEKMSLVKDVAFAKTHYIISPNAYHSSTRDRIVVNIPKNTPFRLYFKASEIVTSQVFAIDSDGGETSLAIFALSEGVNDFVFDKNIVYIGIYNPVQSTSIEVDFAVSLIFREDTANINSLAQIAFTPQQQTTHSPLQHTISYDFEEGKRYYLVAKTVNGSLASSYISIYPNDSDTAIASSTGKISTIKATTNYLLCSFVATSDTARIGLYIPGQSQSYQYYAYVLDYNPQNVSDELFGIVGISNFTVASGTYHSSTRDKVNGIFEKGYTYHIRLEPSFAGATIPHCQFFAGYYDGSDRLLFSSAGGTKIDYEYVLTEDDLTKGVSGIGAFTTVVSSDLSLRLSVIKYPYSTAATTVDASYDFVSSKNNSITTSAKLEEFGAITAVSTDFDCFLFFTDPHIFQHDVNETGMENAIGEIEYAFNNTPTDFVLCGGDWLQNNDTPTQAAAKLGRINGIMEGKFKENYYPILGNHDTNYQGVDASGNANSGTLDNETLTRLWFRRFGKMYYSFKSHLGTRFYVFDTGTDWVSTMNDYRWTQIDWFANQLTANDDKHSAIALHIITNQETSSDIDSNGLITQLLAENIFLVAQAYNAKTSITLNGIAYDFSKTSGKIAFTIAGHSHFDYLVVYKDIPICITTLATYTPTFDLCCIDYANAKLKMVRIGSGSNRELDIVV